MLIKKQGVLGLAALALLMAGCSGGGGGGATPPPASTATTKTQTVSGSVTLSSLVAGSSSAAKAETATAAVAPSAATITIHSYAADDTLIETKQLAANDTGVFATQLTLKTAEAGGGYLVIEVKHPGTSGWSKRIPYTAPADIDINAELRLAQTVVTTRGQAFTVKAGAEDGLFHFGVVRYQDGTRKAVAGKAAIAAAKAAGGAGMELEIGIPAAALPGTKTLQGNLLTFDPSNPDDARSFPGDYLDQSGNRLVSVAFDSIEITDEAGKSVAELAQVALATGAASKAADANVTVRRWIPTGTCASVADFWGQNGNKIPVYTYNPIKGHWDLLGTGTVQSYDTTTKQYTDVSTYDATACRDDGAYYLNIAVSSEDYINAWWNLDYPLLFDKPSEVCVDVTFTDNAGKKLPGLYAELYGDGISRASGTSDDTGVVRLSGVVTGSSAPTVATVGYWNPYNYSYSHQTVEVKDVAVAETCGKSAITVTKPRICTVKGKVTKGSSPAANEYVWAYSPNPYAYGWAYTGEDGSFNAQVRCDVEMELYVGSTKNKVFRVNGNPSDPPGNEVTDDGSEVDVGTIAKGNTPPYAYGYLSSYSVREGTPVTAYIYAWDADGAADYPLNYRVRVDGSDAGTGTIAPADGFKPVSLSNLKAGRHTITATITDRAGASTGSIKVGDVEVVAGNRTPVISYAYASTGSSVRLNRDGTLPSFALRAHAYDPDGDPLSTDWSCCDPGTTTWQQSGSNVNFPGGSGYSAGSTLTFTYTARDGTGSTTRDVTVEVLPAFNNTPYFTATSQSATTLTAPGAVDFTAVATDDDGDSLTYTWKVNGVTVPEAQSTAYSLNIAAEGTYTVTVEVSDGRASAIKTFTVTYITGTTVILQ